MPNTATYPKQGPQFIGIGAARSGSTWVFKQLERNPNVRVPRLKELHYFSRALEQKGPSFLAEDSFSRRLLSRSEHNTDFRKRFIKAVGSNILKPSLAKLRWDCKYFLGRPNDDWYRSLFAQYNGYVCGEITPAYSALDDLSVARLKQLLPSVKVIHFLRDPVDRAWSLVRYHEQRENISYSEASIEEMFEKTMHPNIIAQSNYLEVIQRWEKHFSSEQYFVGFYDDIMEKPHEVIHDIYQFLALEPQNIDADQNAATARVNSSFEKDMPITLKQKLINHYRPMVEQLAAERGSVFELWLKRYDETVT